MEIDSLDVIEYVMEIEEVFHVGMPPEQVEKVRTFGELYLLVCNQLGIDLAAESMTTAPTGGAPKMVYDRMRQRLSEVAKIPIDRIHFDSPLNGDLGMG